MDIGHKQVGDVWKGTHRSSVWRSDNKIDIAKTRLEGKGK
jgi:hypothetical protein